MSDGELGDDVREAIARRSGALIREHHGAIVRQTDLLFAGLLAVEWLVAIAMAARGAAGPRAATATTAAVAAIALALSLRRPGRLITRLVVAVAQMLTAFLLIRWGGDRVEAQILVFGSLAYLGFYRDWRVLALATLVVVVDHALRSSVGPFGSRAWLEYLGWVAFEDIFLGLCCAQGIREMKETAGRRALLEAARARIERTVSLRAAESSFQADEMALLAHRLKQSEAEARKFAMAANRADDAMILTDALGRIEWANEGFRRLLGYAPEEVFGRTPLSLLREDDGEDPALVWLKIRQGESFRAEVLAATKGGRPRRVAADVRPTPDESGTLIHLTPIDGDAPGPGLRAGALGGRNHAPAP